MCIRDRCTSTAVQTDLTWPNSQKEPTYVITFEKSVQTDGLSPSASRAGIRHMQPTHSADPRDATTPPRPQRRREQSASGSGVVSSADLAVRREPGRQGDVAQMRTSSLSPDAPLKPNLLPPLGGGRATASYRLVANHLNPAMEEHFATASDWLAKSRQ